MLKIPVPARQFKIAHSHGFKSNVILTLAGFHYFFYNKSSRMVYCASACLYFIFKMVDTLAKESIERLSMEKNGKEDYFENKDGIKL